MSRAWIRRLIQRRRETGSVAACKQAKCPARVLAGEEARLVALITARRRRRWRKSVRLADYGGAQHAMAVHADEQRRPDVAADRRRWRGTLPLHDARLCVFVDGSGVTTDLLGRFARNLRGTRIGDRTTCGH